MVEWEETHPMTIDTGTITVEEIERGDRFPARIKKGKSRGRLRGVLVNSDGDEIGVVPEFILRASPGTSLVVDNFREIEVVEFLGGDNRSARAKIVEEDPPDIKKVETEFLETIAYRRGELEFDGPLPEIEEDEIEKDVEYLQEEESGRSAGEDEWKNKKREVMSDLPDRV